MIAIIDYGAGNLKSIVSALTHIGQKSVLVRDPAELADFEIALLPGVGTFGAAAERLRELELREALWDHLGRGGRLLGICLGMQLLFESSEESPGFAGLGILKGRVVRSPEVATGSHTRIGWDPVLFQDSKFPNGEYFFAHSFEAIPALESDVLGHATRKGRDVVAVVGSGNVLGFQFHPEKSSDLGLETLKMALG